MDAQNLKKIMIIEDAPDLQALFGKLFFSEGFQVAKAYNGQEALDQLAGADFLPSVILLDLMMPVMDGLEFRRRQLESPKLNKIPVVVMTADSNYEAKEHLLQAEAYLRKPITDVDRLLEITERVGWRK